ncbi:MAG: RHS repeat-associated core domain-containing protein, partial [Brumimicrobium sp.]
FGMQMPGRSHQTDAYRYGFNGMEKDDEVKGESNSLDFGARIYDPRVGRWLSRDKLEGKKPYLTPYQGFKNNPVIFTDPDGNDEYLTTIIKLKDGTTQIIENDKRISQKSMASAAWGTMNLFAVQEFRDIRTTVTYTQGENGAFTKSTTSVAEGEEKFFKEYIFPYDKGTIVDFGPIFGDGKETQPGGFNLTSEDGGVSSTKTISENDAESRDIGALLDALGGLKNGSLGSDDADRIKDLVDMVQDMNELVPIDGSGGEGSDKTAGGGKPIPDANIIIWKYPKDNYYNAGDRPQATPEQMEKGDTVGGNPDKNIYPEK